MTFYENITQFFENGGLAAKLACCAVLGVCGFVLHLLSKRWIINAFEKRVGSVNSKKIGTIVAFLLSTVKYFVYFVIFYAFCKILELPIDSVFIAAAGAGGVAFGLGAQSLIKNIINGFFILIEEQYSVGDIVKIGEYMGTVEEIGIRTTKIKSIDGSLHIIPNGEITVASNLTRTVYPALIDVNLPYAAEADKVVAALENELSERGATDGMINPPKVLGISSLGQYCYTIRILAECEQSKYLAVEREIRMLIMKRLEKENIPMPAYPLPPAGL